MDKLYCVNDQLINNEVSSNEELTEYFTDTLGCTPEEAQFYINQRRAAMLDPFNFEAIEYVK